MRQSTYMSRVSAFGASAPPAAQIALGSVFVMIACACPTLGEVTIRDIEAHWKEREKRMPCLKLNWTESRFYRRGAFTDGRSPFGEGAGGTWPAEDTVVEFTRSLLYDGGRLRFNDDGRYLSPTPDGRRAFLRIQTTKTWNLREFRMFQDREYWHNPGQISAHHRDIHGDAQFRPPMLACWPLGASNGIPLDAYRIGRTFSLGGTDLVVLEKVRRMEHDSDAELWVERAAPFLLVRARGYSGMLLASELTIEYVRPASGQAYPHRWKRIFFAEDGGYEMTAEASVTSHDFEPTVNDRDFHIEFPPNTWVWDRRPGEPEQYILREDGSRRVILLDELRRGATYQDLLETESGKAAHGKVTSPKKSAVRLTTPLIVAALCVSAFFVWKGARTPE